MRLPYIAHPSVQGSDAFDKSRASRKASIHPSTGPTEATQDPAPHSVGCFCVLIHRPCVLVQIDEWRAEKQAKEQNKLKEERRHQVAHGAKTDEVQESRNDTHWVAKILRRRVGP